jgi:hypothetical protein
VRDYFDKIEQEAKLLTDNEQYKDATSRKKFRRRKFDESNENEIILNGRDAFRTNFHNVICDTVNSELLRRSDVYSNILSLLKLYLFRTCQKMKRNYAFLC